MKVMILSDSHHISKTDLLTLLKNNHVDYYIHCGDIYKSFDKITLPNFYLVKGNNDYNTKIPDDLLISIDNQLFFVTHGHRYTFNQLITIAKQKKANAVCFGHSHQPLSLVIDDMIVINPGSICLPRGHYHFPTYCIYDTKTKKVTFYNIKTHQPCNPFNK